MTNKEYVRNYFAAAQSTKNHGKWAVWLDFDSDAPRLLAYELTPQKAWAVARARVERELQEAA